MSAGDAFTFDDVLRAVSFSARAHQGQLRKDGETPYFAHPVRVMLAVRHVFGCEDAETLAAAVLHDVMEDTTADRDDLVAEFGERVAEYVFYLSKDKRLPEDERERLYFEQLAAAPLAAKLCKLGDACDNLTDAMGLSESARRKAVDKAKQALKIFTPGWPEEYAGAIEAVRERIAAAEESLP